jgi:hypothetical protein
MMLQYLCGSHTCYFVPFLRSLGTHISRVRSVRMDAWTDKQIKIMKAGGNKSCRDWLEAHGIPATTPSVRTKYDNEIAKLYTEVLKARVAGRREPKSLKEAKRLKRLHKPKEWWNYVKKSAWGKDKKYNTVSGEPQTSVVQRLKGVSSSSDFWLVAYVVSLVGWAALFAAWNYY